MSQPPYGSQYGSQYGPPVDPYQGQSGWPAPEYPSYGDPAGYPDPAPGYGGYSGYPQQQPPQPQQQPYYQPQGYQQPQPQPQPGYGYPSPPPPSGGGGGRALVIVLAVVLALVVIGGGIGVALWLKNGDKKAPAANASTGPAASATSTGKPPSPTPAATHSGDLRTFLVAPPSGSRNWPKPLGTDRNLSLDQAAELSSDPKARKDMLQQYSFTKGAVQCWIASGGANVVDVRLYQFDTADHAESFFRDNLDATGQSYSSANTATVAGVPGAKSFSDPKKDDQGFVSVISIGLKGDVVFVVSIGEKGDTIDLSVPERLMQQQYGKL